MSNRAQIVETGLNLLVTSNKHVRYTVLLTACGLKLAAKHSETYTFSYLR